MQEVNNTQYFKVQKDPTYIPSHKGARSLIRRVERDEMIELLLEDYIRNNFS